MKKVIMFLMVMHMPSGHRDFVEYCENDSDAILKVLIVGEKTPRYLPDGEYFCYEQE